MNLGYALLCLLANKFEVQQGGRLFQADLLILFSEEEAGQVLRECDTMLISGNARSYFDSQSIQDHAHFFVGSLEPKFPDFAPAFQNFALKFWVFWDVQITKKNKNRFVSIIN